MEMNDLVQMIQSGKINSQYFAKVGHERNRFLEGKEVDQAVVPREFIDSWQRCRAYGLAPYTLDYQDVDSTQKKELFQTMVRKYEFFLKNVFKIFDLNGYIFKLQTREGISQFLGKSALTFMDCSEEKGGTTSSCVCLHEDKPIIIFQPFYYRQAYIKHFFGELHGASAPIHDEKNKVIGALSLLTHKPEFTVQAYHLISQIAKLHDNLYLPIMLGYENQIGQIINCLPQGVALISEKNIIKFYNEKIADLLEINGKKHPEHDLKKRLLKIGKSKGADLEQSSFEIKDDFTNQTLHLVQLVEKSESGKQLSKAERSNDLFTFHQIKGSSPSIQKAKDTAEKIADTLVPVMIYGESGTGKEMFAQAIHSAGNRAGSSFVAINCGAIPGELVESELFGYEGGAFTGALKDGKIGKIEAASGGTLFLDEIESMPLKDQIKLLRVLSTGKVQKVGSTTEISVDIRLISATKTDLLMQADEGLFREDLFYRISTFVINLPALRERKEDILLLAEEFSCRLQKKYDRSSVAMDRGFINALTAYKWRGNVRELEHAMEHAFIMLGRGATLLPEHLSVKIQQSYQSRITEEVIDKTLEEEDKHKFGLLALAEQKMIERVLDSVDGNISAAAERLGINRRTIHRKLQRKESFTTF